MARNKSKKRNPYETKTHNYLLRSVERDGLLDVMTLVHVGWVKPDGFGFPSIRKMDGTWAGNCMWSIKNLEKRGLVTLVTYMDGKSHYELTLLGRSCLVGAFAALGRRWDPESLMARINSRMVQVH